MNYESLRAIPPTLDPQTSMRVWVDILMNQHSWRCFSSAKISNVQELVDQYLRLHATTPGILTKDMPALRPVQILEGQGRGYEMWGALFLNGAVIRVANEHEENLLLFVEDETADRYHYPQDWVHLADLFVQATPEGA